MEKEFPVLVYMKSVSHPQGFAHAACGNEDEFQAALATGWFETVPEALAPTAARSPSLPTPREPVKAIETPKAAEPIEPAKQAPVPVVSKPVEQPKQTQAPTRQVQPKKKGK